MLRRRALFIALALCVHSCFAEKGDGEFHESFPAEIPLKPPEGSNVKIQRPTGIVADLGTKINIATVSGQLIQADIKEGTTEILNYGGDDQPMGGLCLDSRGPGTLYGTGRESGAVYAFNRRGELLRRYQVANLTRGPTFLSGCIQTRYQLIIIDSLNDYLFYLPLKDEGPLRGHPAELDEDYELQGYQLNLNDDFESGTGFHAYGIEWTSKHNETAFLMNSETGELYTFSVKKEGLYNDLEKVNIKGSVTTFPNALQILFDSKNENIMYLSMPHLNAVAVLEFSAADPRDAMFIRWLTNPLMDEPVAIGEYGDWLFPVNGKFSKASGETTYTITQLARHNQELTEDGQQFTTTFEDAEATVPPQVMDPDDVESGLREPPAVMGTHAPAPLGGGDSGSSTRPPTSSATSSTADPNTTPPTQPTVTPTPSSTPPSSQSSSPSGSDSGDDDEDVDSGDNDSPVNDDNPTSVFSVEEDDDDDDDGSSCFPASATVETRERGFVRMDELKIGDDVLVGWGSAGEKTFSNVFLFSHQDSEVSTQFVRLTTDHGDELDLTSGHYLYVNGRLSTASSVREGNLLEVAGNNSIRVSRVERVRQRGLFNPQTMQGDLVVNRVRTSTYTTAVEPAVATALLAPLRAAYFCGAGLSRRIAVILTTGGHGVEGYLPRGRKMY